MDVGSFILNVFRLFIGFMLKLIVAQVAFFIRLPRKNRFPIRVACSLLGCIVVVAAVSVVGATSIYATHFNNAFATCVNIVAHILMFGASFVAYCMCFGKKKSSLLFLCTAGYAIEHIATSVPNPLSETDNVALYELLGYAIMLVCYAVLYFLFIRRFNRLFGEIGDVEWIAVVFFSVFIIFIATVVGSIGFAYSADSPVLYAMFSVCGTMFSVLLLVAQYLIMNTLRVRRDSVIEKSLHEVQLKQYEFIKNNIDSINIRFHDIKHQIRQMESGSGEVNPEYLESLRRLISDYDAQVKTGNEALDVILLEKSLNCKRKEIKFSCLADGMLLKDMEEADLYSLFGNAIDNATEYLEKVDSDKRIIKVFVKEYGSGFVGISVKNYYDGEAGNKDGLSTSKADRESHGFGMRSMKTVAAKYGGSFKAYAEGEVFNVNIVLPLPVTKQK